jgi:hypothetical protein
MYIQRMDPTPAPLPEGRGRGGVHASDECQPKPNSVLLAQSCQQPGASFDARYLPHYT